MFDIDDEFIKALESGYVSAFILFLFGAFARSYYKILSEVMKNED